MYAEILRIRQWYKNITVLIGAAFAGAAIGDIPSVLYVLGLSCLVSSANYIMNEITDLKYDRLHPVKKHRSLASGRISKNRAFFLLGATIIAIVLLSMLINPKSRIMLLGLFIAAMLYNLKPVRLKDVPYVDVISESVNNPIRFMIGWYAVSSAEPDIYLLFLVWTTGAVLMTWKRLKELKKYKETAQEYRSVFRHYSVSSLRNVSAVYLFLSILFCFQLIR